MAAAKNRIWELDALRGVFILCVVIVHTIFDLQIFGFIGEETPLLFNVIRDYGGILFILISGICSARIPSGAASSFFCAAWSLPALRMQCILSTIPIKIC